MPISMTTPTRAVLLGAASLAGGCSGFCYGPEWSQFGDFWQDGGQPRDIPVDAAPWLLRPCPVPIPDGCSLIIDGVRFPVEVENRGQCDLDYYESLSQGSPHVIQTLRLDQPLPPGALATLDCDSQHENPYTQDYYDADGYSFSPLPLPLTLQIRTSADPAAPPGDLADLSIHFTRADPNACGPEGDYLALRTDFDAAFLREGGYIEVVYPNGQVFAVHEPREDGLAWLPGSHGPLTLTPVAIDGERGEPVVIDEDDMTEDAVYIPGCRVDPGPPLSGLLALGWLVAVRRRRRSA